MRKPGSIRNRLQVCECAAVFAFQKCLVQRSRGLKVIWSPHDLVESRWKIETKSDAKKILFQLRSAPTGC